MQLLTIRRYNKMKILERAILKIIIHFFILKISCISNIREKKWQNWNNYK